MAGLLFLGSGRICSVTPTFADGESSHLLSLSEMRITLPPLGLALFQLNREQIPDRLAAMHARRAQALSGLGEAAKLCICHFAEARSQFLSINRVVLWPELGCALRGPLGDRRW